MTKIFKLIIIALFFTSLLGCGSNFMEEADKIITEDNAETPAEFQKLADDFTKTINDPAASEAQKTEAKVKRAAALLSKNGVSAIDMATDLSKLNESETGADNIFNLLNSGANKQDLNTAVKDLNEASNSGGLTEGEQVTRAIANTQAATELVKDAFDVDSEGNVNFDESDDKFEAFDKLFPPENPVDVLAENAQDSFDKSGALTGSQNTEVTDFVGATKDLRKIQDAIKAGNKVTLGQGADQETFDFSTKNDANLENALNKIFKGI